VWESGAYGVLPHHFSRFVLKQAASAVGMCSAKEKSARGCVFVVRICVYLCVSVYMCVRGVYLCARAYMHMRTCVYMCMGAYLCVVWYM